MTKRTFEDYLQERMQDKEFRWEYEKLDTDSILWQLKAFDRVELLAILEIARIGLADEDLAAVVGNEFGLDYDSMVDLHDKLVSLPEPIEETHDDTL